MKKTALTAAALIAVSALASSPALAHRVGRPHRHVPRASIVLGTPRPATTVVLVANRRAGLIDFNVEPEATRIFVDGRYRGTCDEFDGYPQKMALAPGRHTIRLVTPGGDSIERVVEVVAGYEINLNLDL